MEAGALTGTGFMPRDILYIPSSTSKNTVNPGDLVLLDLRPAGGKISNPTYSTFKNYFTSPNQSVFMGIKPYKTNINQLIDLNPNKQTIITRNNKKKNIFSDEFSPFPYDDIIGGNNSSKMIKMSRNPIITVLKNKNTIDLLVAKEENKNKTLVLSRPKKFDTNNYVVKSYDTHFVSICNLESQPFEIVNIYIIDDGKLKHISEKQEKVFNETIQKNFSNDKIITEHDLLQLLLEVQTLQKS